MAESIVTVHRNTSVHSRTDPSGAASCKGRMFLHGIFDTKGVTQMGLAMGMDLPCDWVQFLYTCAERGVEDSAIIVTWYTEGPAVTQQHYMNHGHPDGDIMTSLLAYHWFCALRATCRYKHTDLGIAWKEERTACSRVGLLHHVTHAISKSVHLLNGTVRDSSSYASGLITFPEKWIIERDWHTVNHWGDQFL